MGQHLQPAEKLKAIGSRVTLKVNRGLGYALEDEA